MALANPLAAVQGARIVLGPGIWEDTFVIAPGTSDYVTGGYSITAAALRLNPTYGIMSAWVSGCNAAANGYVVQPTLVIAQIGATAAGAGFEGYSSILFWVGWTGAALSGVLAQVGSGQNLTGCIWLLTVRGQ
jgi:hypothetical protein